MFAIKKQNGSEGNNADKIVEEHFDDFPILAIFIL